MKTIILTIFLSLSYVHAQEQELQHYYRGLHLSTIPLPYQAFKSADYKIVFPDSLYTTAKIHLHKAKISDFKKSYTVFIRIENDIYKDIRILFRGKKRLHFLIGLLRQLYPSSNIADTPAEYCISCERQTIQLIVRDLGLGYEVQLKQSDCKVN
jgi:hypothetical protein